MHDTAMRIGRLALEIYADRYSARILDIGSCDVNGTLRQFATAGMDYVGVDIAVGPGVDIVVAPGSPLPLPDDSFDLVIASSMLEHDPAFWMTFLEMCRKARAGGYIYINAPSNGVVHRFPEDHWRFYPDCGRALTKWAGSQGIDIELVESFTAEREEDIWNDFAAVFRRLPESGPLPLRRLHREIPCTNILSGDEGDFDAERLDTEDMAIIARLRGEVAELNERNEIGEAELALGHEDRRKLRDQHLALEREIARLRQKTADVERQAAQQRALLEDDLAGLRHKLRECEDEVRRQTATAEWFRKVGAMLSDPRPRRWALLPARQAQAHLDRRIAATGLFDPAQYLQNNPDVAADGGQALRHYLHHGWAENRRWE